MGNRQNYINALKTMRTGYVYAGESGGTAVGCSDFTRIGLYKAGIITLAECNNSYNLWAINDYHKVLDDTSRFQKLPASTTKQDGDILWYAYHHVATYYNGGVFEAAPRESHYAADNGVSAVGYFPKFHNCSGGSLTCIYRIVEKETDNRMTADTFCYKLLDCQANYPTHYRGTWGSEEGKYNIGQWDGQNFCFDCSGLLKAILWGWNGNKNAAYGGAIYCSNGVPDINDHATWGFGQYATHTDVENAPKGALLWKQGHVGASLGNGYAIECTPAFNGGVQKTKISGRGWSKWGYLPYVNYDGGEESHPVLNPGDVNKWVGEAQERLNYHGNYGLAIDNSFGPATKKAVLDFQGKHDIGQDGIIGPKTWVALLEDKKSEAKHKVGDEINYNGIYSNSGSTVKLNPKYKVGVITQVVVGANNPYLVSSNGAVAGWTMMIVSLFQNQKKSQNQYLNQNQKMMSQLHYHH